MHRIHAVLPCALITFIAMRPALAQEEIFLDSFELCRTADVIEWDGGGDGTSWNDPLNWKGDLVPVDGDEVAIREGAGLTVEYSGLTTTLSCLGMTSNLLINGGMLILDGPATVNGNLALTSGNLTVNARMSVRGTFSQATSTTLDGPGKLIIQGLFNWTGGNHNGTGETIVNGGIEISGTNYKPLKTRTLSIFGPGFWTGAYIEVSTGATINVNAPFEIATDSNIATRFAPRSLLNVRSTLTKSTGTGRNEILMDFVNDGEINVASGSMTIGYPPYGGTSTGDFIIEAGAELTIRGAHTFTSTSSISGAGTFAYGTPGDSVVLTMNGDYSLTGPLKVPGGTMQFSASPIIPNTVSLGQTTASGQSAGALDVQAGATITGDVTIAPGQLVAGGDVTIGGTVLLTPPGSIIDGPGTITVDGLFTWTGGTQLGAGETVANGGMEISGANSKGLRERTLTLNDVTTWTGAYLDARSGATINVNAPFEIATDANIQHVQFDDPIMNINDTLTKTTGTTETVISMIVTNAGSVAVESGRLHFGYTYAQEVAGTLSVGIGGAGAGEFDLYAIDEAATLAGTLEINLLNGYEPALGESFEIIKASSVVDQFDTVNGTAIVAGRRFDVVYGTDNVTLLVVEDN